MSIEYTVAGGQHTLRAVIIKAAENFDGVVNTAESGDVVMEVAVFYDTHQLPEGDKEKIVRWAFVGNEDMTNTVRWCENGAAEDVFINAKGHHVFTKDCTRGGVNVFLDDQGRRRLHAGKTPEQKMDFLVGLFTETGYTSTIS